MSERSNDPAATHEAYRCLARNDIEAARVAIEPAPDYASSWIVRAELARADGRMEDAREAARHAVRLAPNSPRALLLLEAMGTMRTPEPTFADLFDEEPEHIEIPLARRLSAPAEMPSVESDQSAPPLLSVSERTEGDLPNLVSETLAELLIKQGKRAEARKVYIQLSRLHPERYAYFRSRMDELAPVDR